jgi:hypothetical protein
VALALPPITVPVKDVARRPHCFSSQPGVSGT